MIVSAWNSSQVLVHEFCFCILRECPHPLIEFLFYYFFSNLADRAQKMLSFVCFSLKSCDEFTKMLWNYSSFFGLQKKITLSEVQDSQVLSEI